MAFIGLDLNPKLAWIRSDEGVCGCCSILNPAEEGANRT